MPLISRLSVLTVTRKRSLASRPIGCSSIEGAAPSHVVGWCQVGPRDRLPKLLETYRLDADPTMWAVTCFFLRPSARGAGLATILLRGVMADLDSRGVLAAQGYPRRGDLPAEDAGPAPKDVRVGRLPVPA